MQISVGCGWRDRLLETWIKMEKKDILDVGITNGVGR